MTKVRLSISHDTAFLLEHPSFAAQFVETYKPEVVDRVDEELSALADLIRNMRAAIVRAREEQGECHASS